MQYRLSPSDLTFLYDGCKRCFVLKVKHGIRQPSIPLPGVFSSISYLQKEHYTGKRADEICPDAPPGVITHGEQWVKSLPIEIEGHTSSCWINGRFDIAAKLDDGTYAVLDFKTGRPNDQKSAMYGRQLHAYAAALENPAEGGLALGPVTRLGLLYFTPDHCEQTGPERQILGGSMTWCEVPRDDAAFRSFLGDVLELLDGPMPASGAGECNWCRYWETLLPLLGAGSGAEGSAGAESDAPNCPKCSGPMQLRNGRYGDFWSCLRYPECKGTRNV